MKKRIASLLMAFGFIFLASQISHSQVIVLQEVEVSCTLKYRISIPFTNAVADYWDCGEGNPGTGWDFYSK
jgi:hypothetical protein